MADVTALNNQLTQTRNELHNLRKKMQALKAQHQMDIMKVREILKDGPSQRTSAEIQNDLKCQSEHFRDWKPIGQLKTWFHHKNGTPRQGCISSLSRGLLEVDKHVFNNPQHSLEGLQEYSHIWIFFVFHRNGESNKGGHSKSKVAPPRLNGERIGVFATRSPHRPNPLGLTLAQLDKIEGNQLFLSGLDILDGTPVIDIKPYIPEYDSPYSCVKNSGDLTSRMLTQPVSPVTTSTDISINVSRTSEINKTVTDTQETKDSEVMSDGSYQTENSVQYQSSSCDKKLTSLEQFECSVSSGNNIAMEDADITSICAEKPTGIQSDIESISLPSSFNTVTVEATLSSESQSALLEVKTAAWLKETSLPTLHVIFNPIAEKQMEKFAVSGVDDVYRLEYLKSDIELETAIRNILREDPRSSYRRKKCSSLLYYFTIDTAHITVWFDENVAEVLRVQPVKCVEGSMLQEQTVLL